MDVPKENIQKPKTIYKIYKITSPSGKNYVGQTKQTMHKRLIHHKKKSSNCIYLKRAIEKYGWDNMKVEVLVECHEEHADMYEQSMIEAWNSKVPHGYNIDDGGNSNKTRSEETKKKISEKCKESNKKQWANISKEERSARMKYVSSKRSQETIERQKKQLSEMQKLRATGSIFMSKGRFHIQIPRTWTNTKSRFYICGYNTKSEAEVALENFKANMKSHGIEFAIDTIKREKIRNR